MLRRGGRPTRAGWRGSSRSPTTPATTWCGSPAATRAGRSPRWRPPRASRWTATGGPTPTAPWSHPAHTEQAVAFASVRYDKTGDQHYDVAGAFIKSMRGSDVDAALHYLARMLEAGEDPRFIARRIVISAAEDVGMADPTRPADRGRRRPRRRPDRDARGADHPRPGGRPHRARPQVQRRLHRRSTRRSPTCAPGGPAPCPRTCATRVSGASRLGHGEGYRYAHDEPRRRRRAGVPARRPAGQDRLLPAHRPRVRGAPRPPLGWLKSDPAGRLTPLPRAGQSRMVDRAAGAAGRRTLGAARSDGRVAAWM